MSTTALLQMKGKVCTLASQSLQALHSRNISDPMSPLSSGSLCWGQQLLGHLSLLRAIAHAVTAV